MLEAWNGLWSRRKPRSSLLCYFHWVPRSNCTWYPLLTKSLRSAAQRLCMCLISEVLQSHLHSRLNNKNWSLVGSILHHWCWQGLGSISLSTGSGQLPVGSLVLVQARLYLLGPFCCVGGREPGYVRGALGWLKGKEICALKWKQSPFTEGRHTPPEEQKCW